MNEQNADYNLIINNAFRVTSQYIYDKDMAKEIAQETAIECYLNYEKINQDSLSSWIYVVAKNKSYKYIKENQKNHDLIDRAFSNLRKSEEENIYKDTEDLEALIETTPNKVVPIKQKHLLYEVLRTNYNFRKVAAKFNIKYDTLRKRVYRIHQEILLYQKIAKGHKRTRPIPGTKLHENILRFLTKLKSCLNNNDLSIFSDFKIDIEAQKRLTSIEIKEVVSYQIAINKHCIYEIFIPYFNNKNDFNCFWINLKIDNNTISIDSIPETPSKIEKIKREDLPHPLNKTFRDGPDGMPTITTKELDKKLAECYDKVEVIYEDKNK